MTPATKTIFQVEREARWRVWALFGLLVAIVAVCLLPIAFLGACAIWLVQHGGAGGATSASTAAPTLGSILPSAGGVLLVALLLAVLYWFLSRRRAADRLIRVMHARPLDPDDRFHHRLSDIVEEMRVATGGPAVRCLTVPTRAMNAFTFSDLHGGACIGVTEGALSGLTRRQLRGGRRSRVRPRALRRLRHGYQRLPAVRRLQQHPGQSRGGHRRRARGRRRDGLRSRSAATRAGGVDGHQRRPVAPARVGGRCRGRALHA